MQILTPRCGPRGLTCSRPTSSRPLGCQDLQGARGFGFLELRPTRWPSASDPRQFDDRARCPFWPGTDPRIHLEALSRTGPRRGIKEERAKYQNCPLRDRIGPWIQTLCRNWARCSPSKIFLFSVLECIEVRHTLLGVDLFPCISLGKKSRKTNKQINKQAVRRASLKKSRRTASRMASMLQTVFVYVSAWEEDGLVQLPLLQYQL